MLAVSRLGLNVEAAVLATTDSRTQAARIALVTLGESHVQRPSLPNRYFKGIRGILQILRTLELLAPSDAIVIRDFLENFDNREELFGR
jgi:hypothetical protein